MFSAHFMSTVASSCTLKLDQISVHVYHMHTYKQYIIIHVTVRKMSRGVTVVSESPMRSAAVAAGCERVHDARLEMLHNMYIMVVTAASVGHVCARCGQDCSLNALNKMSCINKYVCARHGQGGLHRALNKIPGINFIDDWHSSVH
jgi:hypothetical protein